jgi:hypothetical protein
VFRGLYAARGVGSTAARGLMGAPVTGGKAGQAGPSGTATSQAAQREMSIWASHSAPLRRTSPPAAVTSLWIPLFSQEK